MYNMRPASWAIRLSEVQLDLYVQYASSKLSYSIKWGSTRPVCTICGLWFLHDVGLSFKYWVKCISALFATCDFHVVQWPFCSPDVIVDVSSVSYTTLSDMEMNDFTFDDISLDCSHSEFGCCPDNITMAMGNGYQGCKSK